MDTTSTAHADIHRTMSQGTQSSSNTSMKSQGDPMDDASVQPFSALPGAQFQDLARKQPYIPYNANPQRVNFSGYRDPSSRNVSTIPQAPRYDQGYNQPFLKWPPARNEYNLPRPTQGTFERLRISDGNLSIAQAVQPSAPNLPQLSQAYPAASQPQAIVHASSPQPRQLQYQQPQQQYPLVRVPSEPQEHQPPVSFIRDPSIDAVQINALQAEMPHMFPRTLPPRLTPLEKVRAFFGNDCLLQRQWQRRWLRRYYKRLY